MAVKKSLIAGSIWELAVFMEDNPATFPRLPEPHVWVLDQKFKQYWEGILQPYGRGPISLWPSRRDWRALFEDRLGKWHEVQP